MLDGRQITLRAWQDGDVLFFRDLRNDVATQVSLMAQPRPHNQQDARCWLELRTREGVFFVIATRPEGDACGFIELRSLSAGQHHAVLGICLAASARGHGYAGEALGLAERYARQVLGLRKVTLNVLTSNVRAVQLYERAGYRKVGVFEAHYHFGNSYHDVTVMEKMFASTDQDPELPWTQ